MTADAQYRQKMQEAYRLEDEGHLEAALDCVRGALRRADDPHVVTTLEEHLRVPHLLQRTGASEETRREFRRLLREGYPDQLTTPSVRWRERGMIYDAMRRAFTRDGRPAEAAIYEGLSHLAEGYGQALDAAPEAAPPRALSRKSMEAVAADMRASLKDGPSQNEVVTLLREAVDRFQAPEGEFRPREVEEQLRRLFGVGH